MTTRSQLVEAARGWLGVPWRHQGRTRRGVDCVGLLVALARELGHEVPDQTAYGRHMDTFDFVPIMRALLRPVRLPEARPGDVLVFAETVYPCHVGLMTERHGRPHVLHAHALRRRVVEEPLEPEWAGRLRMAFAWPFLED